MSSNVVLEEYVYEWPGSPGQRTWLLEGPAPGIEEFISRREFFTLFGGLHLSPRVDPGDATRLVEYLGVQGKRNASRLRRVLRERGAEIQVRSDISLEERSQRMAGGADLLASLTRAPKQV